MRSTWPLLWPHMPMHRGYTSKRSISSSLRSRSRVSVRPRWSSPRSSLPASVQPQSRYVPSLAMCTCSGLTCQKQAWRALSSAAGPGSVSEGMIFGLECFDPRLNFPPILRDDSADFGDSPLPREDVAASSRFWKNLRKPPAPPKQTKRQLDERRSQVSARCRSYDCLLADSWS